MNDVAELSEMTIDELLKRWPQTLVVVKRLRLVCLGCAIAPFCTVAEAAVLHGLDRQELLGHLQVAIGESDPPEGNF